MAFVIPWIPLPNSINTPHGRKHTHTLATSLSQVDTKFTQLVSGKEMRHTSVVSTLQLKCICFFFSAQIYYGTVAHIHSLHKSGAGWQLIEWFDHIWPSAFRITHTIFKLFTRNFFFFVAIFHFFCLFHTLSIDCWHFCCKLTLPMCTLCTAQYYR